MQNSPSKLAYIGLICVADWRRNGVKYGTQGNRQEKKYNIIEAENGIYTETPAWLFITRNETSGKETRIYVNVVTGEIRTRVM